MKITVSLVSHNNKKDLQLLLPSLRSALRSISSEIFLVDNCSSDSTVAFVQKYFPEVVIIRNKKRLGYGANQNQNITKARGKYIVLMNPDMIVPKNAFHRLTSFMENHDNVGIATCNICNLDNTSQYLNKREPAIFDLLLRRFLPEKFQWLFKKRLDYYEMRDIGYDRVVDVPFISGSFMFARTTLINELNGFDKRFFMYFEDVDLCRRMHQKAHTVYYPDVKILHRWERSAHKSLKWTLVFALSGLKYYHKWGYKLY